MQNWINLTTRDCLQANFINRNKIFVQKSFNAKVNLLKIEPIKY